jgi:ornithine decarboxylase
MIPVMTERISRFLSENSPETPCLVVDLDVIAEAYDSLCRHLPLARIFYAVKANPAAEIVAMLGRQFRCGEPRRNRPLPR